MSEAFGAPGAEARWSRSTKEGIGSAYHTSCRLWFTISHGIINEIYYPHIDQPNTRDLQFLVTDGESFFHEERRDLDHEIHYPEEGALLYRLKNSDREGRYFIEKEVIADPHSSVLLIQTRIEITDPELRKKLRVFALLAPHLQRSGNHNSASVCELGGRAFLRAKREGVHLVMGATPDFSRRSVGYVGASDGWQDLQNFKMDWEFREAPDGNVALMGEIDLSGGLEFTLGVGFGGSAQSSSAKLMQSLAIPFAEKRRNYVEQWQRVSGEDLREHTGDEGSLFRLSRGILLAHEDKTFTGAIVASASIPWGETKGDDEIGGYHLVWPRDLVQSSIGLLASGQIDTARRALIWLAALQAEDGGFPQNSWINGKAYWKGCQLDEIAAPILLAWRLRELDALSLFDPWTLMRRAANYLISHGPVTEQERWEEGAGYSPGTLATILAALVCVAEFARERKEDATAEFILSYADWVSAKIEDWTVTTMGELVPEKPRHYVRITPVKPKDPNPVAEPDTAMLQVANGGGKHPARNVVGGDFLALVRLGLRDPNDPLMVDSLAVIDAVIKHDLPQGPCWRRYNHDGYGQKEDGAAFDGTGVGGCWPLLTGERGHFELAAGRDPRPYIRALEKFSNAGGMLPEQVWWGDPAGEFEPGKPTGSAMPLCWAHAEYIALVRSARDGAPFDLILPAHERYVVRQNVCVTEVWTPVHRTHQIKAGRALRIILPTAETISWNGNGGNAAEIIPSETGLGLWFADLPTEELPDGAEIEFTLSGNETERYRVAVAQ